MFSLLSKVVYSDLRKLCSDALVRAHCAPGMAGRHLPATMPLNVDMEMRSEQC